jgi:hypothetical protein
LAERTAVRHSLIEHYKPAKHELGWADFQVRSEKAIVRHWQLVMLAFTLIMVGLSLARAAGGG